MSDIVTTDSLVRHKVDGRIMSVKAVFKDENGSPSQVECEVYQGEGITTVWVPLSELEPMTRF